VRNFAGWEGFDGYARNAMFKILGEDKVRPRLRGKPLTHLCLVVLWQLP
jgi:hypothetical protein